MLAYVAMASNKPGLFFGLEYILHDDGIEYEAYLNSYDEHKCILQLWN